MLTQEGFWDDPEKSKPILKERTAISNQIDRFEAFCHEIEDCEAFLELAEEEDDEDALKEVADQVKALGKGIKKLSIDLMLSGEDDQNNAIVSINAGAGGTEAQDWAEMLFRMYLRWVEQKGYKYELIDLQPR